MLDSELLRRYRDDGDEEAFGDIVARFGGMVFGVSRRILRNDALAEEIAQETFFRLVKRRNEVRDSVGGWLHQVATTLSIDLLRSERGRQLRELARGHTLPRSSPASEWSDVSPLVDEALAELPPRMRELLVRRYLNGQSQADLAEEYAVSPATLSRRMTAGIEELRAILRRKGVVVAAATLALWMRDQALAGAITPALTQQLGKITLVSTTTRAAWTKPAGWATLRTGAFKGGSTLAGGAASPLVSYAIALVVMVAVVGAAIGYAHKAGLLDPTPQRLVKPAEPASTGNDIARSRFD